VRDRDCQCGLLPPGRSIARANASCGSVASTAARGSAISPTSSCHAVAGADWCELPTAFRLLVEVTWRMRRLSNPGPTATSFQAGNRVFRNGFLGLRNVKFTCRGEGGAEPRDPARLSSPARLIYCLCLFPDQVAFGSIRIASTHGHPGSGHRKRSLARMVSPEIHDVVGTPNRSAVLLG